MAAQDPVRGGRYVGNRFGCVCERERESGKSEKDKEAKKEKNIKT